ncbi:MAG TPA: hypothetical protein VH062_35795 [Polyangiaceae bacterium]|jgi:hypothetical protein|nr:hypothetical protein [Polyangiaceae bacterium]
MSTQRGPAPRWWALTAAGISVLLSTSPDALALDKQGSAHGGDVSGADSGFDVTGSASLGVALYNPTYAARPDNTGHTLFRYVGHADIDLIGQRLSIPIDVNLFTDRDRHGGGKLIPSELDLIGGVTTTWGLGPGAIEFGVRAETDRNVDRGNYSQTYVDARTRYLYSLADQFPELGRALDGNVTGAATLGAFVVNPTYAARPDNSGLALLRYALHGEMAFLHSHAAVGLDGTMFTDRHHHPVAPSELDLTPELIARFDPFEVHLAYERDMPVSEPPGITATHTPHVQHFVYVLASWSFDAYSPPAASAAPASTESPPDDALPAPSARPPAGDIPPAPSATSPADDVLPTPSGPDDSTPR